MIMCLDLDNIEEPKPTEKMLRCLDTITKWLDIKIPKECYRSFMACSNFLYQYLDEACTVAEMWWYAAQRSSRGNSIIGDEPREGSRFYYADSICKYDSYLGKYVDERDYDNIVRDYGSSENKNRMESAMA